MKQDATDRSIPAQKRLLELTQKRLERFVTFLPKFLVNDDPDTIHDLRVWSRRLQQTLRSIDSRSKPRAGRKIIKILRRVRQALGSLRNLDVNRELVQDRLEKTESPVLRSAWEALQRHLEQNRGALLADARAEVAEYDLVSFIERAQKLIAGADRDADPAAKLGKAVIASLTDWDEAHRLARETSNIENLHALRIATKRLRYRAELAADVGAASLKPLVKDLKELQSALGDWHDRSVLLQTVAEFIPEFRGRHPQMAAALVAQIEEETKGNDDAVKDILNRIPKLRKRWDERQDKQREN
jgi:CHAD domain-containing protein